MPHLLPPSCADLQVNLQLGRSPDSGCNAVSLVINGIPSSAHMPSVVAAILVSIQGALGVQLSAQKPAPLH